MFSYGGFSSIIPYIGYLSVMWVCILICASGHLNNVIGIFQKPEFSIESLKTLKSDAPGTIHFSEYYNKKQTKPASVNTSYGFFQYLKILTPKIIFFEFDSKARDLFFLASAGLRAPPCFID